MTSTFEYVTNATTDIEPLPLPTLNFGKYAPSTGQEQGCGCGGQTHNQAAGEITPLPIPKMDFRK